jgi:hypothetical protein
MKLINEILNECKQKPATERVQFLRNNDCFAIRETLKYALHPMVQFFTTDIPKYKADDSPVGLATTSLHNEVRMLYCFLAPHQEMGVKGKVTKPHIKQRVLLQMLESIDRNDALVVESMFKRNFAKTYGINQKLAEEAFPGLFK